MIISGFHASSRCRLSLSLYYTLGSLQRRLHASHASHPPLHRHREMVEMTRRRIHGNGDSADKAKSKSPTKGAAAANGEREHHDHGQPHTHTHSHGIFGGHSHSHGHDHGGGLIETLQSGGKYSGAHSCPIPFFFFVLTHATFLPLSLTNTVILVSSESESISES